MSCYTRTVIYPCPTCGKIIEDVVLSHGEFYVHSCDECQELIQWAKEKREKEDNDFQKLVARNLGLGWD